MVFLMGIGSLKAQRSRYSKRVEGQIKRVEESLGEAIVTSDTPILLSERMKEYNVPAVSIAVIRNFKLEWARAYGTLERGRNLPATPDALFQAASISKTVNALGALSLVQNGKVALNADVDDYLKGWRFPYDSAIGSKKVTLAHLLSHTGGTTVHGFRGYARGEPIPTLVQILNGEKPANNKPVRLAFEPGVKAQYSGGGITIVQKLMMDVTGSAYEKFMYENVLRPLGMEHSFYDVEPGDRHLARLATGHYEDGSPLTGRFRIYPEQAAASLWTSPSELGKCIVELQKAFNGKGRKTITRETAQIMLTPVVGENGLGTFIKKIGGVTYFSHGGANEGFRSYYVANLEKGDGVIVMINSNNSSIIPEIVNSVAVVYNWTDFYKPVFRATVKVPDSVLARYVGVYEVGPGFSIVIALGQYGLTAQASNQPSFRLYAEDRRKFFYKVVSATIEFVGDDSGSVLKLVLKQNGQVFEARRKLVP